MFVLHNERLSQLKAAEKFKIYLFPTFPAVVKQKQKLNYVISVSEEKY